jgi:sugar/nucleoside kinase (ribokinase family)
MNKVSGVLCSGSIVYDTIVQPFESSAWGTTQWVQSIEYHVGGNGANTARAMAILGLDVRLLGAVGTDAQGDMILNQLSQSGVDTTAVMRLEYPTAATVVLVNSSGNRQFLHRLGVSKEIFRQPVEFTPQLCDHVSHYHFASLFMLPHLRVHGADMLRRARAAGLFTSLDTNWDAEGQWMRSLEPCLQHLDILFMNEDEAAKVTGSQDPAAGARVVLEKGVKTAVMKLSDRGCAIYTEGKEIWCPAFEVSARDSTGAGDCFVAGFLTARQQGGSWAESGRFGNAVAALSVQKLGAVTGVLSQRETEEWMSSAPLRA